MCFWITQCWRFLSQFLCFYQLTVFVMCSDPLGWGHHSHRTCSEIYMISLLTWWHCLLLKKSPSCIIQSAVYCWHCVQIVQCTISNLILRNSRMRFYARIEHICFDDPSDQHLFFPLLRSGCGSWWRPRRDSGHRDGRKRRELLGRAEERLGCNEEPGGSLQRPALRGQERTRWA